MTAYKPYNFEDNEPTEQERELGMVYIGTQCPICNHVYKAQFVDGDKRALQLALEKAEARAAELEAQVAQLREALTKIRDMTWLAGYSISAANEMKNLAKAALSATPAQSAAHLAALEAEHEAALQRLRFSNFSPDTPTRSDLEWRDRVARVEAVKRGEQW